ncbi:MAG: LamG domain-containing protein, partial [Acidobacteriota bacterium]|nr:LamG domain-containing protein [Acidobacteriota bacterium]
MTAATTLFELASDPQGPFDGSVNGVSILRTANAKVIPRDGGISLERGLIDVARHRDLDQLQSFTLDAVINPKTVGGGRQNIVEAQTPSVAFFIEANGKLIGSVHTAAGWVTVDSGATLVKAGVAQRVTFTRDATGNTELQIDNKRVGTGVASGAIQNVGTLGF